jgi:hypothetical protein
MHRVGAQDNGIGTSAFQVRSDVGKRFCGAAPLPGPLPVNDRREAYAVQQALQRGLTLEPARPFAVPLAIVQRRGLPAYGADTMRPNVFTARSLL